MATVLKKKKPKKSLILYTGVSISEWLNAASSISGIILFDDDSAGEIFESLHSSVPSSGEDQQII